MWPAKFIERVRVVESGCWEWVGARRPDGYGLFYLPELGRQKRAHRWGYEALHGSLGKLFIDHLCRNPPCVRPDHLEAVAHRTNTLRGVGPAARKARQSHCAKGHPLSGDNVYVHPSRGTRNCRACSAETSRRRSEGLAGTPPCSSEGCRRASVSRGWCKSHYMTWWRSNR